MRNNDENNFVLARNYTTKVRNAFHVMHCHCTKQSTVSIFSCFNTTFGRYFISNKNKLFLPTISFLMFFTDFSLKMFLFCYFRILSFRTMNVRGSSINCVTQLHVVLNISLLLRCTRTRLSSSCFLAHAE